MTTFLDAGDLTADAMYSREPIPGTPIDDENDNFGDEAGMLPGTPMTFGDAVDSEDDADFCAFMIRVRAA